MRNKTTSTVLAVVLSFALLLGMIPSNTASAAKKVSLNLKKLSITVGESKTLKVKNTQKKVTWKVLSGKKNITLKKKGKAIVSI
jgi:di/tricarboxylate transporter